MFWPYSQMSDWAVKACQEQMLHNLFGPSVSDEEKSFVTLTIIVNVGKHFSTLMFLRNQL
jgi:hypothetical protein